MDTLPVANITKSTFDQLDKAISSSSGKLDLGTSGPPWGKTPDIFKAVMAQFPDSNIATSGAVDFDAGTNFGAIDQEAFVIIVLNGLDAPLKLKTYYRDSGDMTAKPYYDEIVYPPGELGQKKTFSDQIPGRQVIMKNRRYGLDPSNQNADIETYGCGCWKFVRRGGFYGVGCAISLESEDPDFKKTIAIAGDVDLNGSGGYGFTSDLTGLGKDLATFHSDTADKAKGVGHSREQIGTSSGSHNITITSTAHLTNIEQYNSYSPLPGGMMPTQLYTLAVSIKKTVT